MQARIGAGGMGEVYRARDTTLNRDVALKVLSQEIALDAESVARFEHEARVLASLNHSNIAIIHELRNAEGIHVIVMEYVEGDTLTAKVARGPLEPVEIVTLAPQIADAVLCENSAEAGSLDNRRTRRNRRLWPQKSVQLGGARSRIWRVLHRAQPLGHACAMDSLPPPLAFVVLLFAGWVNRQQQAVIDYLLEENRVLRAAHGPRRLRLTDDQRRRLVVKGKVLGRRRLAGIVGIVTPDTILRWYRTLVAKKYDGSNARRPGRPSTKADLAALVVRLANENPTWGSYEGPRCQGPFVSKGNLHTLTIAAEADSS